MGAAGPRPTENVSGDQKSRHFVWISTDFVETSDFSADAVPECASTPSFRSHLIDEIGGRRETIADLVDEFSMVDMEAVERWATAEFYGRVEDEGTGKHFLWTPRGDTQAVLALALAADKQAWNQEVPDKKAYSICSPRLESCSICTPRVPTQSTCDDLPCLVEGTFSEENSDTDSSTCDDDDWLESFPEWLESLPETDEECSQASLTARDTSSSAENPSDEEAVMPTTPNVFSVKEDDFWIWRTPEGGDGMVDGMVGGYN